MTASTTFDPSRLNASDPPPLEVINPTGDASLILCCDHAANAVPAHMAGLGLPKSELKRHIGWDIGAAAVTRHLAARKSCPAFLSGYSRLIIDCNRPLDSPTSIPLTSDGSVIPANQGLSATERRLRQAFFFAPYHQALANFLDRHLGARRQVPVFVSMHSFTPVMNGFARPWQLGLLFEHDRRLVAPLKRAFLALDPALSIGENEPYAIRGPSDYSIPVHGQGRGLPHIELEVRQDLIETEAGAARWAALIAEALDAVLADPAIRQIERF
ncbi:MAG: N-formylglutamate amidohydrolase [Alphaproteobacteria bacterium]|nr:N-formylglutamate amidohydrolase [Alphaproteobacteria bacterium]